MYFKLKEIYLIILIEIPPITINAKPILIPYKSAKNSPLLS